VAISKRDKFREALKLIVLEANDLNIMCVGFARKAQHYKNSKP
jgi:hypothetical protein